MECKAKTDDKNGLKSSDFGQGSKAGENNEQYTTGDNSESIGLRFEPNKSDTQKPISENPADGHPESQNSTTTNSNQPLSRIGINSQSAGKSEHHVKMPPMKRSFRFIPRILQTQNKSLRITKPKKLPIPEPHEMSAEPKVNKEDINKSPGSQGSKVSRWDVGPDNKSCITDISGYNVDFHSSLEFSRNEVAVHPNFATQSSNISHEVQTSLKLLPTVTELKENEDPSNDPFEEFNNCERHPNCKLTLEEVKSMADRLPSCMGFRLRVNFIRQIYKHGRDPDTWDWKKYENVLPDYTFFLSQPTNITKNVPHTNCKISRRQLTKMAQDLPYSKSRKCFIYLCYYYGLDPEETFERILKDPLVPWVACPEPWRALEKSEKPPEYPRVKEGYYTPKSVEKGQVSQTGNGSVEGSSHSESSSTSETNIYQSQLEAHSAQSSYSCTQSNTGSKTGEASTTQPAPSKDSSVSFSFDTRLDRPVESKKDKNSTLSHPTAELTASRIPSESPKEDAFLSKHNISATANKSPHYQSDLLVKSKTNSNTTVSQLEPKTDSAKITTSKYQFKLCAKSATRKSATARECIILSDTDEKEDSTPKPVKRKRSSQIEIDTTDLQYPEHNLKSSCAPSYQFGSCHFQQQMSKYYQNQFHSNPYGANNFYASWSSYGSGIFSPWNSSPSVNAGTCNIQSNPYQAPFGQPWNSSTYNEQFFIGTDNPSWKDPCAVSSENSSAKNSRERRETPEKVPLPPGASFKEFLNDWSNSFVASFKSNFICGTSSSKSNAGGTQPPLPTEPPPPLPDSPPPTTPPPPPLPSTPLSSESVDMDWMELGSPESPHQQGPEACLDTTNAFHDRSQHPAKGLKFTFQKTQFPSSNPKSPSGSDIANKDPISLNKPSTVESPQVCNGRGHIPVFIEPNDYPYSRLSDGQMTLIENNILSAILEIGGVKPVFVKSFRRNGRYGVICSNEFSRNWLYAYFGTHRPWPNCSLRITAKNSPEITATAILPVCLDESNKKILTFIGKQNEVLDVSKWEVVRRWESNDFKTYMDLIIDDKSAAILEKRSSIIFKMGTGKIVTDRKEILNSEVSSEQKKSGDFDSLEDDIYAEFYDAKSPSAMKKSDFDSLEQDIYADIFNEGSSDFDEEYLNNKLYKSQSFQRSSRSKSSKSDLRSPSPCSRQSSRHSREDRRRMYRSSLNNPRRDQYVYYRNYRRYLDQNREYRSPTRSPIKSRGPDDRIKQDKDEFSAIVCASRSRSRKSSKSSRKSRSSPGRSSDLTNSASSSADSQAPGHSLGSPGRPKSLYAFPHLLSFQTQGYNPLPSLPGDETTSSCPSPPKIHSIRDFSASRWLDDQEDSGFSRNLHDTNLSSAEMPRSQSPSGKMQDASPADLSDEDSNIDSYEFNKLPTAFQNPSHNVVPGINKDKDCNLADTDFRYVNLIGFLTANLKPVQQNEHKDKCNKVGSNLLDSNSETRNLPVSKQHQPEPEDSVQSGSDSQDSEDLPAFECRPGQSLQDAATEQFRKLMAAGYSCEKALQVTQSFVSRQVNVRPEIMPEPPKPQQPPKPTLHEVAAEKFDKLIGAGFSYEKAMQFTQAFVRRQSLPPQSAIPRQQIASESPQFSDAASESD